MAVTSCFALAPGKSRKQRALRCSSCSGFVGSWEDCIGGTEEQHPSVILCWHFWDPLGLYQVVPTWYPSCLTRAWHHWHVIVWFLSRSNSAQGAQCWKTLHLVESQFNRFWIRWCLFFFFSHQWHLTKYHHYSYWNWVDMKYETVWIFILIIFIMYSRKKLNDIWFFQNVFCLDDAPTALILLPGYEQWNVTDFSFFHGKVGPSAFSRAVGEHSRWGVGTALGLDNASGNMGLDIRKYVELMNMNLISGNI